MKIVGLTGNIGSGKSTVSKVLIEMGYPVFNADEQAKSILENDSILHHELQSLFGNDIFHENKPDRKKMAALVFNDNSKLQQLNSLIHPLVQKRFEEWCSQQKCESVC